MHFVCPSMMNYLSKIARIPFTELLEYLICRFNLLKGQMEASSSRGRAMVGAKCFVVAARVIVVMRVVRAVVRSI